VPEQTNESAWYLEYTLAAAADANHAALQLNQRIKSSDASAALKNFLGYIKGKLDRKAVLDAAGRAATAADAQQQICEAAYWLAQHERLSQHPTAAAELLKLATQIGNADMPEFQFAQWQLQSDSAAITGEIF